MSYEGYAFEDDMNFGGTAPIANHSSRADLDLPLPFSDLETDDGVQ
jgi:hypothetical protein